MDSIEKTLVSVMTADGDEEKVNSIELLRIAFCSEMLSFYRYLQFAQCSRNKGKSDADPEFLEHESDELEHAKLFAARLDELNAAVPADPATFADFWKWEAVETSDVKEMLEVTIADEEAAIEFYGEAMLKIRKSDPTSYQIFRNVRAKEEEHLHDLEMLLGELDS